MSTLEETPFRQVTRPEAPHCGRKVAILQSFRTVDVPAWIARCMESVRQWALSQNWDYFFLDDRFLDLPPSWVRESCGNNLYAVTDIARLVWAREVLSGYHDRAIWVDADVLVMQPDQLTQHVSAVKEYGFARELFLHITGRNASPKWGLNNSLMVFDRYASVLEEYLQMCLSRLESSSDGEVPRTAMGPTLLNQMDASGHLNRIEGVGLFTPAMLKPYAAGQNALMRLYLSHCAVPPAAANLCHFMRNSTPASLRDDFDRLYMAAIDRLLLQGRMHEDSLVGTLQQL